MRIELVSVDSIIIYFENIISKENANLIQNCYKKLKSQKNKAFIEIVPSYSSIMITYDIFIYEYSMIKDYLFELLDDIKINDNLEKIITNIDVYYGLEVGLDLEDMSNDKNLSIDDIVGLHSSIVYDVYAIGFLPGFAYMANVDKRLVTPRLKSPRKHVPKGSVAIADSQTTIYPQASPGGWNVIGKTTLELFDKTLVNLSPLSIESKIKFNPITKKEFLNQGGVL